MLLAVTCGCDRFPCCKRSEGVGAWEKGNEKYLNVLRKRCPNLRSFYRKAKALLLWVDSSIISAQLSLGRTSQVALVVKNLPTNAGDARDSGLIPGLGRCPGGGHGNPLQYSCLENPRKEEPGGLQSIGLQRVGHDWSDLACIPGS